VVLKLFVETITRQLHSFDQVKEITSYYYRLDKQFDENIRKKTIIICSFDFWLLSAKPDID
jgi:hypothetical protein